MNIEYIEGIHCGDADCYACEGCTYFTLGSLD